MQASLDLHTSQQIALTPQAMQAIHLLQLSAADLEHEIEEALASNPLLVREEPADDAGDPPEAGNSAAADSTVNGETPNEESSTAPTESDGADDLRSDDPWVGNTRRNGEDIPAVAETRAAPTSLRDHLHEQLAGSRLQPLERALVETVIEALDDDGYLRQSVEELLQIVPPQLQASVEQVELAIRFVQSLDPAGVAARSLAECLALQLERRAPADDDAGVRALALRIVREHLESLALHDGPKLAQELACDDEAIRRANLLIRSLNPRPGAAFADVQPRYVIADVIVRKVDGRWVATVNPQAVPNLRIDRILAEALQRDRVARGQFAQHLREARALIHNVQQRFVTIQRVAQAIVERQRLYFELGELALRPLALRDVARTLRLHPSTVSRVCSNKYARTPAGVIELKRFFSPRASHTTGGIDCSSAAIRALISELIAAEDPRDPLSDVQLTRQLASRGINVARRTVAKHRAALGIPPVESRRMSNEDGPARQPKAARPIAALAFERRAARRPAPQDGDSTPVSAPYSFKRL